MAEDFKGIEPSNSILGRNAEIPKIPSRIKG
jgi:hypothetical protein